MSDDQEDLPFEQSTTLSGIPQRRKPGDPVLPPSKSVRPKRRRKGYLNDGKWAPGYGPNAKKK